MGRPRKKPAEGAPASNSFLDALLFVGAVLKETGTPLETHILLSSHWAVGSNGIVTAGSPIKEKVEACPNYNLLKEALSKCENDFTIDKFEESDLNIYVRSGKFKAVVPCIDRNSIFISYPDAPVTTINDSFKKAIETVSVLINENGQYVYMCSILMNGMSVITTDTKMIFEYWHAINLPPGLLLPKAFAIVLGKISKNLLQFGFSQSSATFYFTDGSWIKTQLYNDTYPDVSRILNVKCNMLDIPKELFNGLNAVAPFSDNGLAYFDNGIIRSHLSEDIGASYEIAGLPKGLIFNIKQLQLIKDFAKQIDFFAQNSNGPMTVFYGDNVRGCIAGRM